MKTKRILSVFLLIVLVIVLNIDYSPEKVEAQESANFLNILKSTAVDITQDVIQTSDGGYVITGGTQTHGGSDYDIIVSKFSAVGDEEWTKIIGDTEEDYAWFVEETQDNGYVITGRTGSYGGSDRDIIFTKLNSSGIEQWTKTIGGAQDDLATSILELGDGSFMITGEAKSYGVGNGDIFYSKLNSSGIEQWTKTIGGAGYDSSSEIIEISTGGYLMVGMTESYGGADRDIAIIKVDTSGVEQWTKTIGGAQNDRAYSVVETSGGDFVLTGETQSYGGTDNDIFLTKVNSNGVEQWTKIVGGALQEIGLDLIEDSVGDYVVIGETSSYGGGSRKIYLGKFNSSGVEQWSKVIGSSFDLGYSITETTDNGYALTGFAGTLGGIMLAKVDVNGEVEDCTTQIVDVSVTEVDQAVTEADETVTEATETITEVDETVTEIDVTPIIESVCATLISEDTTGIEVNIAEVITLDCGADVDFGTVTPGTPVSAETTCTTTSNAETGYTLEVKREDADTTMDHTTDDTANITDKTAWTGTGGTTTTWTGTGLGFAVYASSTGSKNTTDWGLGTSCHDALNEYTGFPDTYQSILSHSAYASAGTTTSVCYRVDIPSSQKSGSYDGVVTYQVYTNP